MSLNIQRYVSLARYTSFGVGGPAAQLFAPDSAEQLMEFLQQNGDENIWLLGYGSNTLISDEGLPGTTILLRGGEIRVEDDMIIADAGVWWDRVVSTAIEHGLWGIECLSEIPGSVGAGVYINIAAYGQSIGPRVAWVDVWDSEKKEIRRIEHATLLWSYKKSIFQTEENKKLLILRIGLKLYHESKDALTYQKALDVAEEMQLDPNKLEQRRKIIIEARARAGSLWGGKEKDSKTVGSFFRNPLVTSEQVEHIISHDESGKTAEQIRKMNQSHGGDEQRVSAAHVMLAAGFQRGQRWGNVMLNEQNLLKIEALPGANAQEIYDVMRHIQKTVQEKLDVALVPEARILGSFE